VHTTTIDLLIVAVVVALIAHRFRLPYTVGLVLTGIALTFIPMRHMPFLTHDVIFDVILPPLLFEAAISIHWNELRRDAGPILILGAAWPLRPSLLFGVLIAATDPVAVVATFKDNDIRGRLRLLVETESFLNDGVAAVLFSLVLTWIQASASTTLSPVGIARTLALMAGGSIFTGLLCGGLAIVVAGRTGDHLVESTLTGHFCWLSISIVPVCWPRLPPGLSWEILVSCRRRRKATLHLKGGSSHSRFGTSSPLLLTL
jgi:monovalent cation:H+ antiporter, CPA1 family